jgi:hypothetical protein
MRNLRRRLELLEKKRTSEPLILKMPDGRTETLRGHHARDLLARACRGDLTPEMELIAQSVSSTEPDGAHFVELARAILNSPK